MPDLKNFTAQIDKVVQIDVSNNVKLRSLIYILGGKIIVQPFPKSDIVLANQFISTTYEQEVSCSFKVHLI